MPVTSFALLIMSVLAAAVLAVWAASNWGILPVIAVVLAGVVLARWGLAHVPYDEHHRST